MAEGNKFSLLAFKRTDVDAARTVVLEVSEVARPEYEMGAIGKKDGPAVGLILCSSDVLSDQRRSRSINIDALKRTLGVWGIDDCTVASPASAASRQSGSKNPWRTS
jgi:hypothetical protein